MASSAEFPLTPAQQQILKVLARPMTEEEIMELRRVIVRHFASKLTKRAEEVWDENDWKEEDTERLRERHLRTPYDKQS